MKAQEKIINALGYSPEIIQEKISDKHKDSFWYDGYIARFIKPNGTEFILIATGETQIRDKEGYVVFDVKERNNGIKGGLNDDDDLKKIDDENYSWEMNNWFEVIYKKEGDNYYDSDLGIVVYDYDEGLELLKSYYESEEY